MFLINYNNSVGDRESENGQQWMTEKDIVGRLSFTIPYAGVLLRQNYIPYVTVFIFGILIMNWLLNPIDVLSFIWYAIRDRIGSNDSFSSCGIAYSLWRFSVAAFLSSYYLDFIEFIVE